MTLDGQTRVLNIFRRYLMGVGQMLCLSGNELDANKQALDDLVHNGLLVAETFKGAYSLTDCALVRCAAWPASLLEVTS